MSPSAPPPNDRHFCLSPTCRSLVPANFSAVGVVSVTFIPETLSYMYVGISTSVWLMHAGKTTNEEQTGNDSQYHSYNKNANIAMASSDIAWICGQCTNKNEGGSEPVPCHFCQTPHPKRKAAVVSGPTYAPAPGLPDAAALLAVASASPTKPACIRQPARSSGSVIDLSAPDAEQQAVASASPAKPVCIGQPARSSGSVIDLSAPDAAQPARSSGSAIDLSAPDAAQAVASALLAKAVSIRQPAPCSSGSVIDLSAPDTALAVASALPAKPVFICQPAPRSSDSAIDLSAPDTALAVASTSPAKPVFGLSYGIVIEMAGIDTVKEIHALADQNHVLAIVVGQLKSQEQEAAYRLVWTQILRLNYYEY